MQVQHDLRDLRAEREAELRAAEAALERAQQQARQRQKLSRSGTPGSAVSTSHPQLDEARRVADMRVEVQQLRRLQEVRQTRWLVLPWALT